MYIQDISCSNMFKVSGIQRHEASPVSQLHVSGQLGSVDGIPQDKNNPRVYSYNRSVL